MSPFIEQIRSLLSAEHSEIAMACEKIMAKGSPSLTSFELPLKSARDIYYVRAELNALNGSPIRGFDELVHNLKQEATPTVGIQFIQIGVEKFFVFTNPDITKVIGILLIPS